MTEHVNDDFNVESGNESFHSNSAGEVLNVIL